MNDQDENKKREILYQRKEKIQYKKGKRKLKGAKKGTQ
jgi:hypothetical protein